MKIHFHFLFPKNTSLFVSKNTSCYTHRQYPLGYSVGSRIDYWNERIREQHRVKVPSSRNNSENVKIFLSSKQNRLEQLFSIQYNDDRFQIEPPILERFFFERHKTKIGGDRNAPAPWDSGIICHYHSLCHCLTDINCILVVFL